MSGISRLVSNLFMVFDEDRYIVKQVIALQYPYPLNMQNHADFCQLLQSSQKQRRMSRKFKVAGISSNKLALELRGTFLLLVTPTVSM